MNEESLTSKTLITTIIALIVGVGIGYYYGFTMGGKAEIVKIEKAQEEALKKAQEEVAGNANPFQEEADVNPFEGGYENPFGSSNPFE